MRYDPATKTILPDKKRLDVDRLHTEIRAVLGDIPIETLEYGDGSIEILRPASLTAAQISAIKANLDKVF